MAFKINNNAISIKSEPTINHGIDDNADVIKSYDSDKINNFNSMAKSFRTLKKIPGLYFVFSQIRRFAVGKFFSAKKYFK